MAMAPQMSQSGLGIGPQYPAGCRARRGTLRGSGLGLMPPASRAAAALPVRMGVSARPWPLYPSRGCIRQPWADAVAVVPAPRVAQAGRGRYTRQGGYGRPWRTRIVRVMHRGALVSRSCGAREEIPATTAEIPARNRRNSLLAGLANRVQNASMA